MSTPIGWMGPNYAQGVEPRMSQDRNHWSNTILPYMKSTGLYEGPGLPQVDIYAVGTNPVGRIAAPAMANASYNGLLHAWSATAVASPSRIPLIWNGRGKGNAIGNTLTNPALHCPTVGLACIYTPSAPPHGVSPGGYMFQILNSMWMWSKGGNVGNTDTSAKFRRFGMALTPANTDPYTDPYTGYNAAGNPGFFWCNTGPCYPYLFRPDYEPVN